MEISLKNDDEVYLFQIRHIRRKLPEYLTYSGEVYSVSDSESGGSNNSWSEDEEGSVFIGLYPFFFSKVWGSPPYFDYGDRVSLINFEHNGTYKINFQHGMLSVVQIGTDIKLDGEFPTTYVSQGYLSDEEWLQSRDIDRRVFKSLLKVIEENGVNIRRASILFIKQAEPTNKNIIVEKHQYENFIGMTMKEEGRTLGYFIIIDEYKIFVGLSEPYLGNENAYGQKYNLIREYNSSNHLGLILCIFEDLYDSNFKLAQHFEIHEENFPDNQYIDIRNKTLSTVYQKKFRGFIKPSHLTLK